MKLIDADKVIEHLEKVKKESATKMKINNVNCTQTVDGRVKELKVKGQNFPTMITVEYQVAGKNYVVTESLKLKSEKIRLGFLPIGQKRVPVMGNTAVGSSATVNYNPSDPEESFITHNTGEANI